MYRHRCGLLNRWRSRHLPPQRPQRLRRLADDPQFQDRLPWIPRDRVGTEQVPSPIKVVGEEHPLPTRAPSAGEHTDAVLHEVLGLDDDAIAALRQAGALG